MFSFESSPRRGAFALVIAALAVALTARADEGMEGFDDAPPPAPMAPPEVSRRAFMTFCATCHGVTGRGDGPTARLLSTRPRDFTRGEYKFRTTASGELPTDADLLRTIDRGLAGTAMPSWKRILTPALRRGLVAYVKTFSPRFEQEPAPEPMARLAVPLPPPATDAVVRGRAAYERLKCWECHGRGGRGDGPSSHAQKDSAGFPIDVNNLVRGVFRGGDRRQDIYRTLTTGLDGTPMPSYEKTASEIDRRALATFVRSLRGRRGLLHYLFAPLSEQR